LWDGKVIVDEIRQFKDSRGMLTELWRVDDDTMNASPPAMSYWSVTNPLVMRGPHEHLTQDDWFVSWFNRMVYQLYNPQTNEMFHFITDPLCVYRIKVGVGIIHSYRNLEQRPMVTGNFPSALFMGKDKKSPIDEIRHEEKIGEDLKTYVIIGAGGRLGKAVTKTLFDNMGYHKYHVIPVYEKFLDKVSIQCFFDELFKTEPLLCKPENTHVINCAALTNVQSLKEFTPEVRWVNVELPETLAKTSAHYDFSFYHISSDYVYRVDDNSVYTQSKKQAEEALQSLGAYIIRAANLFSLDVNDTHNIISKLKEKAKNNEAISADPVQMIFPTEVGALSKEIIAYIDTDNRPTSINICGHEMTIEELYRLMGGQTVYQSKSSIFFNQDQFAKNCVMVDCSKEIDIKIKQ
jgi:dTDP-4-dehydrorhamnose 3,5-epimerase